VAIILVDYFVVRRGAMNIDALYEPAGTSTYAKFDTSGLINLAAGATKNAAARTSMGTHLPPLCAARLGPCDCC